MLMLQNVWGDSLIDTLQANHIKDDGTFISALLHMAWLAIDKFGEDQYLQKYDISRW